MFSPLPTLLTAVSEQATTVVEFPEFAEGMEPQEAVMACVEQLKADVAIHNDGFASRLISGKTEDEQYMGFALQTGSEYDMICVYSAQANSVYLEAGANHSLLRLNSHQSNSPLEVAILAHIGMWSLRGSDKTVLGSTHAEAYQNEVDSAMTFSKNRAIEQNKKLNGLRRMAYGIEDDEDVVYLEVAQEAESGTHYIDFNLENARGRVYLPLNMHDELNLMLPHQLMLNNQPVESLSLTDLADVRPSALHTSVEGGEQRPFLDVVFEGSAPVSHVSINTFCTEVEELMSARYWDIVRHQTSLSDQLEQQSILQDYSNPAQDVLETPEESPTETQPEASPFPPAPEEVDLIGLPSGSNPQ